MAESKSSTPVVPYPERMKVRYIGGSHVLTLPRALVVWAGLKAEDIVEVFPTEGGALTLAPVLTGPEEVLKPRKRLPPSEFAKRPRVRKEDRPKVKAKTVKKAKPRKKVKKAAKASKPRARVRKPVVRSKPRPRLTPAPAAAL